MGGSAPAATLPVSGSGGREAQPAAASRDGRDAESPWKMPLQGWKQVLLRTWKESSSDNVGLIAAGVAFYAFLALVPLLGAIVLTYGFVAEPATVVDHMRSLTSILPVEVAKLIGEQLLNVVHTSEGKKGLGLLAALGVALFGARNGAGAVITALNVAYEEEEKRSFIRVNLLALAMTGAAVVVALLAVGAVAALAYLHELLPNAPGFLVGAGKILSYLLLGAAATAAVASLYRYGPSRQTARWVWLTPGSVLAALLWLVLTLAFGIYVANFGNYNATYGSLGAVVVLLTWIYLSSYILLFGAELNSELEHQTEKDTTEGQPQPLGDRGAWVADHVAPAGTQPAPSPEGVVAPGTIAPAAPDAPQPAPSPTADYVTARAANRAGRMAGLRKVGMLTSALSTFGLALLRRKGKAKQGAALLAAAAGLAWMRREDD